MTPLLTIHGLRARYGVFEALSGIDLALPGGTILAVIGANGAGKSTLLKSVMGQVDTHGVLLLDGEPLDGLRPYQRVLRGVSLVPEGRRLFPSLSVEENLVVGAVKGRSGPWDLDAVYDLFPNVPALRGRPAGALSGGEQQAVAIGRGLMANPRVLLLDEVSLGLAPVVVGRLYDALAAIGKAGQTMVVVEQDVGRALDLAGYVHCLRAGRTVLSCAAADVTTAAVTEAYFGGSA